MNIGILLYLIPALMIVVGIPLILRLIPPNPLYGFRTEKAFSSPDIWYRLNRATGLVLVLSGLLAVALNLWVLHQLPDGQPRALLVGRLLTADIIPMLTGFLLVWLYSWRL